MPVNMQHVLHGMYGEARAGTPCRNMSPGFKIYVKLFFVLFRTAFCLIAFSKHSHKSKSSLILYCICVVLQLVCQFIYCNSMQHAAPQVIINAHSTDAVIGAETVSRSLQLTTTQMQWSMNEALGQSGCIQTCKIVFILYFCSVTAHQDRTRSNFN